MAVYFAVGTPTDDGRIQDFRMVPPPGGNEPNQVLLWNPVTQEPEWKALSSLIVLTAPAPTFVPLVTDTGQYLITDTGARLTAHV